jgi:uncharacterized membrane protein
MRSATGLAILPDYPPAKVGTGQLRRTPHVIVEDIPNQRIAWRSIGRADVDNVGSVRFDDRGATTNIEVSLEYNPPGGKAGELVAELVKDPDKQVQPGRCGAGP